MGVLFKEYLASDRVYSCSQCRSHAADHADLISKARRGEGAGAGGAGLGWQASGLGLLREGCRWERAP